MKWILITAVAVEVGWLVVANLLLLGPLSHWLSHRPERLSITWSEARSYYPGHVQARDFKVRSQSQKFQMEISSPEAKGRLGLVALLFKRVTISGLEARDVLVRARHRLDAGEEWTDLEPHMPPIEGLQNPPHNPPPPRPKNKKRGWQIIFSDTRPTSVAEVWVDGLRVGPGMVASGDARIVTRKLFQLSRVRVELDAVHATSAGTTLARDLEGSLEVALDPIPLPRTVPPGESLPLPLDTATFDLRLEGDLAGSPIFKLLAGQVPWLSLDAGPGRIDLQARGVDGVFEPPGSLDLKLEDVRLVVATFALDGDVTLDWQFAEGKTGWASQLNASSVSMQTADAKAAPLLDTAEVSLSLSGPNRQLSSYREELELDGELRGGTIENVAAWNALLPQGASLGLAGGRATMKAQIRGRSQDDRGSASAELKVEHLQVDYQGQRIAGRADLDLEAPEIDLDRKIYHLDGSTLRLESLLDLDPPWSGTFRLTDGWIRPGYSPYLRADADIDMSDVRLAVGLFLAQKNLPEWIAHLIAVKPVTGQSALSLTPKGADLGPFEIEGEHVGVRGVLALGHEPKEGLLYAHYRALSLGLELADGERDVKLMGSLPWYEDKLPALLERVEARR
ncbi:MAG: hypothetical protein SX243_01080 [Acidobacteriota bacterium]|nr:hypothetical protein [Acidobacteriota bacterium]